MTFIQRLKALFVKAKPELVEDKLARLGRSYPRDKKIALLCGLFEIANDVTHSYTVRHAVQEFVSSGGKRKIIRGMRFFDNAEVAEAADALEIMDSIEQVANDTDVLDVASSIVSFGVCSYAVQQPEEISSAEIEQLKQFQYKRLQGAMSAYVKEKQ